MVRNVLPVVVLALIVGLPGVCLAQGAADSKQIENIRKILKTHEDAKVRAGAAYTLGLLGAKAESCLEDLVLACGDESAEVAKAAKEAIQQIASGNAGNSGNQGNGQANDDDKSGSGTYKVATLAVNPDAKESLMHLQKVWLNKGKLVIDVKNSTKIDVDCYLDKGTQKNIAKDDRLDPDCHIEHTITEAGYYTIVLDNLGNMEAKGLTVTYKSGQ